MLSPELSWLPAAPALSEALQAIDRDEQPERVWSKLVELANSRIDSLGTLRLDRKLALRFGEAPPSALSTKPIRLAVLASSTVEHLLPAARIGALRRGLWLTTYTCSYGQYSQELLDPDSALHQYRPDAVLFALDSHHMLAGFEASDSADNVEERLELVCTQMVRHWAIARNTFGKVIQQTVLPVHPLAFGNNEHRLAGSRARLVDRLNERIRSSADREGVDVLAIDTRAAQDGIRAWHDPALWHRAKQEVHPAAAPLYGDLLGRLLAAQQGRSYKCLVLDLDNTLWGGVIGDDGLEGIVLGQGNALGEAFAAFQQYARTLSQRGVILAVCSKNDETNALQPFDQHPEMVLRRSDIACFIANWTDKAANLRSIAERLNIGLDSLVFVDDNPFERNIVRRELPAVAVPELPDDPALYASCLAEAGYFEGVRLTAEDLERTRQYQANHQRESLKTSETNLDEYLHSLKMEMRWSRFDRVGLQRIVQLINKTNQFNLTTKRYSDETVIELISDQRALTLQIRLVDQFGDNGIIAIAIGRPEAGGTEIGIDTWLMSCRVLGRQVEQATLNLIAAEARRLGATRLLGEYRPTAKNGMVCTHYAKLGFTQLDEQAGGITRWELPLDSFRPFSTFITSVEA
jgi:FkbH-like protein